MNIFVGNLAPDVNETDLEAAFSQYGKVKEVEIETEGIYEEYKDPDQPQDEAQLEEEYDDQEEADAIDVEGEMDYEIEYTDGININVPETIMV